MLHLTLDKTVLPVILPVRKVTLAVKETLKGELKPKIELISLDSQSDEILDFKRYLC